MERIHTLQEHCYLPDEIIFEILSWLPVKHLLRFKCVCKQWRAIIHENKFITKQFLRASVIPGAKISGFSLMKVYYGLLLEKSKGPGKYRIRNPSVRRVLELPDPHKLSFIMNFSWIRSSFEPKLISVHRDKTKSGGVGYEILAFGRDELSWRPLKGPTSRDYDYCKKRILLGVMSIHEMIYYVWKVKNPSRVGIEIDIMDAEKERFTSSIVLPGTFFSNIHKVSLFKCRAKLSFAEVVKEDLLVLILEDPKNLKWDQKKKIPLRFLKENPEMKKEIFFALFVQGSEICFRCGDKTLAYDTKSGIIRPRIFPMELQPSLITLRGMKPE